MPLMCSSDSRWKMIDLVDPVQELGLEGGLHQLGDPDVHVHLGDVGVQDELAADVGGHDDHRVLEVDGAAVAVGEPAFVQDLQQQVEDVGVGLLDLVQQQHRVGAAPHGLGQVATLVVAHVAGRRPDEAGDRVPLLELAHVHADEGLLVVEHELRQGPAELGLAHAGGAQEDEAADGPVGVLQAGAGPPDGRRHRLQRVVLADHPLVQPLLHVDELLHLALQQPRHRDAGPLAHHLGDVLFFHLFFEHLDVLLQLVQPLVLGRSCRSASGMLP